jgi:NAD(P)-dependent dehydrogenase (short-subunit alcohol dehydrogenase family)
MAKIVSKSPAEVVLHERRQADTATQFGKIDVLVNNAGLNVLSSASALSEDDYDRIMNTNVKGAFFMTQVVGTRMVSRNVRGRIINIASIGAFKANKAGRAGRPGRA